MIDLRVKLDFNLVVDIQIMLLLCIRNIYLSLKSMIIYKRIILDQFDNIVVSFSAP